MAKLDIQWFPGHMAKAKRLLSEQLRWIDVVIELGDARLPVSSRNPLLKDLLGKKQKLLLLNKGDLADPKWTEQWVLRLKKDSPVLAVSAASGAGVKKIVPQLESMVAGQRAQWSAKGIRPRPMRVMVVGIPNIGKSSLINQLTGGAQAKTGNKPGVTRGNQWIRIHERVELLDTPGMLWPKFEDQEIGRKLASIGTIKDKVFDQENLATWVLEWLSTYYPEQLIQYSDGAEEVPSLELIGKKRGCLIQGGRVDTLKAAQIILREFRAGKLGKITLDRF